MNLINIACICLISFVSIYESSSIQSKNYQRLYEHLLECRKEPLCYGLKSNSNAFISSQSFFEVLLGSNREAFTVTLDTASSDLSLPSIHCHSASCIQHSRYNCSASSTCKQLNRTATIVYGEGTATGYVAQDTLQVNGITVEKQEFVEITNEYTQNFLNLNYAGIFGLGKEKISKNNLIPPIFKMISNNSLANKVFCLYYERNGEIKRSKLNLGYVNTRLIKPLSVNFIPTREDDAEWKIYISYISTNKNKFLPLCELGCEAVVDSGKALIFGPSKQIHILNKYVGADLRGDISFINCAKIKELPDIIFSINLNEYRLKGSDYVIKYSGERGAVCVSGFHPSPESDSTWRLGELFLANFYTIFNLQHSSISFSTRSQPFPV